MESVIEGMAAYYSEQLSQNIKRGQRQSASKAQCIGGNRPLGYLMGPDKKFMIDPDTAPIIRKIYEQYSQGKRISEIIQNLNEQGFRTRLGKPFTKSSLRSILKNEKYIGVYAYKDEIRIEDGIPPIIEKELFYKVQEMLKYNQKYAAHVNPPADYLLSEKLFCGKCGTNMVGVSGTSRNGDKCHYYYCSDNRKKVCTKKPTRKAWIENLVISYAIAITQDNELLDFIAEKTYQYYIEQNTDSAYTDSLNAALAETEKALNNLVKALEAGIFNDSTKTRMDELDCQKSELKSALAATKLKTDLGIKKEHILYFLHKFSEYDYEDVDCQKRLIKTFINSVFVYDDKVVISFNYSGDGRTITVNEIDAGLTTGVQLPSSVFHQRKALKTLCFRGFCISARNHFFGGINHSLITF